MKKRAFTLTEIIITLSVIGIIMVTTAISTLRIDKIKEKRLTISSNAFYSSASVAFNEIVLNETSQRGIKNLTPTELMIYFARYMESQDAEFLAKEYGSHEENEQETGETTEEGSEGGETGETGDETGEEGQEQPAAPSSIGKCDSFVGGTHNNYDYIKSATKCVEFPPNFIAGFYVNKNCNEEFTVQEYKSDNIDPRDVTGACGYIVYEPKNSTGTFGRDLFVIGLGNRSLK